MKKSKSMNKIKTIIKFILTSLFIIQLSCCTQKSVEPQWPSVTTESKPWTRWWWMGNAVDEQGITAQLEAFSKAGLGGVEITPIYGVKGYEDQFLDYLSPKWLKMLGYTLKEAKRLGLKVDMVMGTGWPYGGSQVKPEYAASKLQIQTYPLTIGQTFNKTIEIDDKKQRGLASLVKIIYVNKDGKSTDLTSALENSNSPLTPQEKTIVKNKIVYTPTEDGTLYAIFCGKTRQQVKRAAPGGKGYTLDHFSKTAFDDYAEPFTDALAPFQNKLHGIFNDSYEVYGADFSPEFLNEFKQRRGYDLMDYINILNEKPDTETYHRLLCDYRETLSDMLLNNFAQNWHSWANDNSFETRYQAHGSPGNLIDLWASADIPECEVFGSPEFDIPGYRHITENCRKGDYDKMYLKFCSSAAHLQGKEIVSSESFTWLREHFKTALSHCKPVTDNFFLCGINHMFLHGATYSPADEKWPGWKFYASVNFNPNNTIWKDASALFAYIGRCQAILQKAQTDNDILLYYPIYDAYTTTHPDKLLFQLSLHSIDEYLYPTSFYKTARELDKEGFSFDFLSDQFLTKCEYKNNGIIINDKATYKTIIVPEMHHMPLESMKKLIALKEAGAQIIFMDAPKTVPGLNNYKEKENELQKMISSNENLFFKPKDIKTELNNHNIFGEKAYRYGLKIIRKKLNGDIIYFAANHTASTIDKFIPFNVKAKSVLLMNPMNSTSGLAQIKPNGKTTLIRIQLEPGESIFIRTSTKGINTKLWHYLKEEKTTPIKENWQLTFKDGGPALPHDTVISTLQSWTNLGKSYEAFSGTGVYKTSLTFNKQDNSFYKLDLGDVRESARVYVNGQFITTLFAQPYKTDITAALKNGKNELEIEVTNLAANRVRNLEQSKTYEWKKFYEINMVDINYKKFDAAAWEATPSGLLNNVNIISYKEN